MHWQKIANVNRNTHTHTQPKEKEEDDDDSREEERKRERETEKEFRDLKRFLHGDNLVRMRLYVLMQSD